MRHENSLLPGIGPTEQAVTPELLQARSQETKDLGKGIGGLQGLGCQENTAVVFLASVLIKEKP